MFRSDAGIDRDIGVGVYPIRRFYVGFGLLRPDTPLRALEKFCGSDFFVIFALDA